jgi:thiamine pyrophosphate-dependent acetolactate synthase large subunit-like protein
MNLGCLATVGEYPASLKIILINNGLYEVTGGQTPVGAGRVDFAAIGRACGISNVVDFSQLSEWSRHASNLLSQPGPALIVLRVAGRPGQKTPSAPRPMSEQIERLTQALGS